MPATTTSVRAVVLPDWRLFFLETIERASRELAQFRHQASLSDQTGNLANEAHFSALDNLQALTIHLTDAPRAPAGFGTRSPECPSDTMTSRLVFLSPAGQRDSRFASRARHSRLACPSCHRRSSCFWTYIYGDTELMIRRLASPS